MKGHIVVNGLEIPVTDVALRSSKICLTCEVAGPLAPFGGEVTLTVFGEDGTGLCQADCAELAWPRVLQGEVLTVRVNIQANACFESIQAV